MTTTMVIIALVLVLLLAGWLVWETTTLAVEYVEVRIAELPPEFEGFRIAQISDLHGRRFNPAGRVVREVEAAQVDLIAATGDYVHGKAGEIANVLPLMEALTAVAPVYAVSGNHDHRTDWPFIAGRMRDVGVTVLENEHVRLARGDAAIILAGVNDPRTGRGNLAQALPELVETTVVLLAHAPTWFETGRARSEQAAPVLADANRALLDRCALTLVGHTHGGQIKLPLIGAVTTASGRLFPKTHIEGLSWEGSGWLYINRGLGQGGLLGLRFLSRPELTIITLYRA